MEIDFKNWKYINGTMHEFRDGYYYDTKLNFRDWAEFMIKEYKINEDDTFYDYLFNKNEEMNYKLKAMRGHLKYLFDFMVEGGEE